MTCLDTGKIVGWGLIQMPWLRWLSAPRTSYCLHAQSAITVSLSKRNCKFGRETHLQPNSIHGHYNDRGSLGSRVSERFRWPFCLPGKLADTSRVNKSRPVTKGQAKRPLRKHHKLDDVKSFIHWTFFNDEENVTHKNKRKYNRVGLLQGYMNIYNFEKKVHVFFGGVILFIVFAVCFVCLLLFFSSPICWHLIASPIIQHIPNRNPGCDLKGLQNYIAFLKDMTAPRWLSY